MKLPKIKNFKRSLIIGLTLSIVLSVVGIATAQELVRTITITPPTIALTLKPGEHVQGQMKIINDSPGPLSFSVSVQDYIVVDNVGTPNILPPNTLNSKYSAASWIGTSPYRFTIAPKQKQVVDYFVQIPIDAKPCGHYAASIFTPDVKTPGATGARVSGQIGSLFYITVSGKCKEQATVTNFFTDFFHEYGPVNILTQIKNFGDLHITPKGTVSVSGLFVNESQDLPTHNIFPQTTRNFENIIGQTLMIGRYKAELLASYGINNNLPLTATVYFWVFPWRIAVVIVLVVIAIILGWMYWKKRKKEEAEGHKEPHTESVEKNVEEKEKEKDTKTPESPKKVG